MNWQTLTNYANQSNYNRNSLSLYIYIYIHIYIYTYTHTHIYIYIFENSGEKTVPHTPYVHVARHTIPAPFH